MENKQKQNARRFLLKVVAAIAVVSAILSVFIIRNLDQFQKTMDHSLSKLSQEGAKLSVDECAVKVVDEVRHCTGMLSLCEQSVPRLMTTCLSAQSRAEDCKARAEDLDTARLGYKECAARGEVGRKKPECGTAYRAFADYCRENFLRKS